MTPSKTQPRDFTVEFNRVMYGAMVALSAFQLFFSNDIGSAMSTLGIGLIFDPFDPKVLWSARATYQKAILLVHVSVVALLLGITVFNYFAK